MNLVFVNDCAVDGCYKKNLNHKLKNGQQMCKEHQEAYDRGEKLKAFYGKTVQKKIIKKIT